MIFLGYLISFCILSIIWIFSLVAFINISVNKDIIKPANYMENQVEKLKLDFKNLTPKMPRGMPKEKYADHIYKALDFYNRYLEKKRSMEAR